MKIEPAIAEMRLVFCDLDFGVAHTLDVLRNAAAILAGEAIVGVERDNALLAAVLHDIGAVEALRKYGSIGSAYQEEEGPSVAAGILRKLGYANDTIERVCFIVGHHHTQSAIDGMDFQVVWEADALANLAHKRQTLTMIEMESLINVNFVTGTGMHLAKARLLEHSTS